MRFFLRQEILYQHFLRHKILHIYFGVCCFFAINNKCTNICDTNSCNAKNFDAKNHVAKINPQSFLWIHFCHNSFWVKNFFAKNFCVIIFCLFIFATVYSAACYFHRRRNRGGPGPPTFFQGGPNLCDFFLNNTAEKCFCNLIS